jgi:hypothetical protein
MNVNEAKLQQLNAVSTYRVYGHALESEQESHAAKRSWIPIRPCRCVQDSPQHPCGCYHEAVWWLPADAVMAQGSSSRKDHDGKELHFFDLRLESKIMVESLQPLSVAALKGLGTTLPLKMYSICR